MPEVLAEISGLLKVEWHRNTWTAHVPKPWEETP
jgi:hypothetical protein